MKKIFLFLQILTIAFAAINGIAQTPLGKNYNTAVPDYDLDIKVLPEKSQLQVSGTVILPKVGKVQASIPLLLNEGMRELSVEVLQPAAAAGEAKVEMKGKSGPRAIYFVIAPKPIAANESVKLRFSYSGGEKDAFVYHLGSEGSFAHGGLSAWYPLLDAGGYTGHTGKMSFSVPAGQTAIATGKSLSTISEMAQGNYRFEVTQPSIFSFAAGKYTIARRTDRPSVAVYQLRPRQNIDGYLKKGADILYFLEKQFGHYPFGEFSMVEVPTEKAAGFFGASSAGIIFIPSAFIDAPFDYSMHGHEISHQWWGNLTGPKGKKGGEVLSEGMAQFGSLLTVENFEGAKAAQGYRQTGYPSIGKYNFTSCQQKSIPIQSLYGYLMMTAAGGDQPLDSLQGELAHSLAVSKGFLVLDLLSRTVGRARFSQILASFIEQNAFREFTWEEFLQAVQKGTGENLEWFYEQWFRRTGVPDLNLTWTQKQKSLSLTITQTAPFYHVSIEVVAKGKNKEKFSKTIEVNGEKTEVNFPVNFKVQSVVLNPQALVPAWTAEYHAEADEIKRCSSNTNK